jgi:NOL1/NOP2/fmu family ribosome biogenesis protein
MVRHTTYKDREALVIEGGGLRATVLPQDGAKMASLTVLSDGKELLACKSTPTYRPLTANGSYVDAECSAFDDMFPTIDPYTPEEGPFEGLTYPDHGEICRLPFSYTIDGERVQLCARSGILPFHYTKTLSPASDGLDVHYRIENDSDEDLPCLWAGHMMLQGEDGIRLCTPFSPDAPIEMIFATKGFAPATLPRDRLTGFAAGSGAAYKFYYLKKIPEGRLGVVSDNIVLISHGYPIPEKSVFSAGVLVGTVEKDRLVPSHQFFSAYGDLFLRQENLKRDDVRLAKYLSGEEIDARDFSDSGWSSVLYSGIALGGGKASLSKIKNHYPKGLRNK